MKLTTGAAALTYFPLLDSDNLGELFQPFGQSLVGNRYFVVSFDHVRVQDYSCVERKNELTV